MATLPAPELPYCGAAPVPAELWSSWNLDPVLLVALGALLLAYRTGLAHLRQAERARIHGRTEPAAFYGGWLVLTLALVSPLCSVSVALFSARVTQHMLLVLVAAPLLALGRPLLVIGARRPRLTDRLVASRLWRACSGAVVAWMLFALLLWLWHAPGIYEKTFESDLVYWTMHLTLFGSALLLWRVLLPGLAPGIGALQRLAVGFTTLLHMGLLGALITVAPRLLYAPHVLTSWAWGLAPIEDQQLGGLIMWVPGGSAFILAGLLAVAALLQRAPEADAARGPGRARRIP